MADVTCQSGLGAACYYGALPASTDQIVLVLLQNVGQAVGTSLADNALRDHATLSALLAAGGNLECTAANYARPTISSGTTISYSSSGNYRDFFWPDRTITNLGSATGTYALQQVNKLLVCYQPASGGPDSAVLPLVAHDYFHVCDGNDFVLSQPNGSYRDVG